MYSVLLVIMKGVWLILLDSVLISGELMNMIRLVIDMVVNED